MNWSSNLCWGANTITASSSNGLGHSALYRDIVGSNPTDATNFVALSSNGLGNLTFNEDNVGSTPTGATMIALFIIGCFAIPLIWFGIVIYGDRDLLFLWHSDWRQRREANKMAKKLDGIWKQKDGKQIKIGDMSDQHLANSIRMITRAWADSKYLGKVTSNLHYKALVAEAKKRKFQITLFDTPFLLNGRKEYVNVFIPQPLSRISAGFFPTEWDSRPQE